MRRAPIFVLAPLAATISAADAGPTPAQVDALFAKAADGVFVEGLPESAAWVPTAGEPAVVVLTAAGHAPAPLRWALRPSTAAMGVSMDMAMNSLIDLGGSGPAHKETVLMPRMVLNIDLALERQATAWRLTQTFAGCFTAERPDGGGDARCDGPVFPLAA